MRCIICPQVLPKSGKIRLGIMWGKNGNSTGRELHNRRRVTYIAMNRPFNKNQQAANQCRPLLIIQRWWCSLVKMKGVYKTCPREFRNSHQKNWRYVEEMAKNIISWKMYTVCHNNLIPIQFWCIYTAPNHNKSPQGALNYNVKTLAGFWRTAQQWNEPLSAYTWSSLNFIKKDICECNKQ